MVIGITGSIATGKSLISSYLMKKSYKVIDCDVISRQIFVKGENAYSDVIDYFGNDILDDALIIDRKRLGDITFNNPLKRKVLEEITHKYIISEVMNIINSSDEKIIFVDAPLLYESKLNEQMDKVIVIASSFDIQLKRLIGRDQIDEEYALKKINSQMPLSEKIKVADYVIYNNSLMEDAYKQMDEIMKMILKIVEYKEKV